jgi:hypothetical protein
MHPPTASRLDLRRPLLLAATLLAAGAVLVACGTSKAASNQPSAAPNSAAAGNRGAVPGAFGTLAEIDGHILEVQNQATGQVSVSYSAATTFSLTRTVSVAALRVGDCVVATGQRSRSSGSAGSPAPSPSSRPTSFPASSVQISAPVRGTCVAAGFGGGTGNRSSGFPSGRPSGFPSGRPSGFPSGRPSGFPSGGRGNGNAVGFGEFATGTVLSLSTDSMTVQTPARGSQPATTDTITLSASTSYTETGTATAAALKVGQCISATGKTSSTGSVAASRISMSPAGADGCSFGGFGRRPGASSTGA